MSGIAEHDKLYLQGQALGDSSHDQRSWSERLKAEQPAEVSVAAGVLASHVTAGDNPRVRDCPTCRAPATKPCRRRSRAGLVAMTGYHPDRRLSSETAPSPGW
jgi:hypothetical protein